MGTTTGEADDRVVVSEGEVRAGELCVAKQHLAELLLAYRGYVILEDALPVDFVRTLARAFQPLYDACTSAAASEGDGRIWPPGTSRPSAPSTTARTSAGASSRASCLQ